MVSWPALPASLACGQLRLTHNVNELLHLSLALGLDLAHLERDQVAERADLVVERLADLADDLATLRSGHVADGAGGLGALRDGDAGLLGGGLGVSSTLPANCSFEQRTGERIEEG